MRPVQGPVIALLAVVTGSPAWAEVCDKERPDWSPSSGPVTMIGELSFLLMSPVGGVLVGLCVLSWLTGRPLIGGLTCVLSWVLCGIIWEDRRTDIFRMWRYSRLEGCAGDPLLAYVALVLLGCIAFMGGVRRSFAETRR